MGPGRWWSRARRPARPSASSRLGRRSVLGKNSLVALWEEGVTTAEIGRGRSQNAVIGKVHRIGLVPRVVKETPPPRRNVFEFTGPACMWPIGHPTDNDFHFCGGRPAAGKPYCEHHAAVAYIKPKEKPQAA